MRNLYPLCYAEPVQTVHLTPSGAWAECNDAACALKFHVPDIKVDAARQMPLQMLLPLFETIDPPFEVNFWGEKTWRKPLNSTMSLMHREYDLPALIAPDGRMEWWQDNKFHRYGKPAIIRPDGTQEYWERGDRVR